MRPRHTGDYMSLLTVQKWHTDRKAEPTVMALAGVCLVLADLKQTDPTTLMLPIYTDEVDEKRQSSASD